MRWHHQRLEVLMTKAQATRSYKTTEGQAAAPSSSPSRTVLRNLQRRWTPNMSGNGQGSRTMVPTAPAQKLTSKSIWYPVSRTAWMLPVSRFDCCGRPSTRHRLFFKGAHLLRVRAVAIRKTASVEVDSLQILALCEWWCRQNWSSSRYSRTFGLGSLCFHAISRGLLRVFLPAAAYMTSSLAGVRTVRGWFVLDVPLVLRILSYEKTWVFETKWRLYN
jgi:hypothetical protein